MEIEAAMLDEDLGDLEEVDTQADDEPDTEDEFEYDEDGNIIIPDVVFDEGEDDYLTEEFGDNDDDVEFDDGEESSGGEDEDEDSDADESDTDAENTDGEEPEEPKDTSDSKDVRIAQLEAELRRIKAQGKETLAKMGVNVKDDDIVEGLMSIAAEAEGTSLEDYAKKKAEEAEQERAKRQVFEDTARADIAELHAAYPETKQYSDVRELPRDVLVKFARARDAGFSAKEAYAAANPDGIRNTVATAVKKKAQHESKSHLRSTVPKGSKDNSINMSKADLTYWRDIFPGKSDKEIQALYKKTAN